MSLVGEIQKLKEKRAKLVAEARATYEAAEKAGRALDGEDKARWERMIDDAENLGAEAEKLEKLEKAERSLLEAPGSTTAIAPSQKAEETAEQRAEVKNKVFRAYLAGGKDAALTEARALNALSDAAGSYTYAPEQFIADLLKAIDDQTHIRQRARVIPVTSSDEIGVPSLDANPAAPAWTSEITTASVDSTMSFGKRSLHPYQLTKEILVSNKLLRISALPIEGLVRDRLAYQFATTEEASYLAGSGSSQPLGVFTASASGISTGQDVSTGNTTTSITTDGLMEAFYFLKAGYSQNAVWMFSRAAVKQIAKLKDGDGQYIWRPGITEGQPAMLLGRPCLVSENASFPVTFTTGLYVGIFGDFSYYWIADMQAVEIVRLSELYAETGQTAFIGRRWLDAAPVLEAAFARVKLA